MPYLDKIVDSINIGIMNNSIGFVPRAKVHAWGIAETILDTRQESEDKIVSIRYPGLIDDDGEVKMIDVDDNYHVIIYHKVESIVNTIVAKSGYGNSMGNYLETANMSVMFLAFRDKVRKAAWWFEAAIKDQVQETVKLECNNVFLQRSNIRIATSSFDKLGLLQREYSEVELNYPNLIVFEIKYRVESTWKKGCFAACGSGNANFIATETGAPITTETGLNTMTEN